MQRVLAVAMLAGLLVCTATPTNAQKAPVVLVCSGFTSASGDTEHQRAEDGIHLVIGESKVEMPLGPVGEGQFAVDEHGETEIKFQGPWSVVSGQKPVFAAGTVNRITGSLIIATTSTTEGLALGPYFIGRCAPSSRLF